MSELLPTMSDSKWCRLLSAIAHLQLPVSYWRFIADTREFNFATFKPEHVIEHKGSRGIGDFQAAGPFFFREVETVRWPATFEHNWAHGYAPVVVQQPLRELAAALDGAGKFDYSLNERELILFAYRRQG
jgi:hypothetical protein